MDDEREEFIEASKGVAVDAFGQTWRWSSYGRGPIPAWHPAMLGRRRESPRTFAQDLLNGTILLALLFGTVFVALAAPERFRVIMTLGYIAMIVLWLALAHIVALRRAERAEALPQFPHPGPKGHHHHG